MSLPTLYAKNAKGKMCEWTITVSDHEECSTITTKTGQQGGKMRETEKHIKVGKNLKKKNATTFQQQAALQAQSSWKKKKESGMIEQPITETPEMQEIVPKKTEIFSPMLAHEYLKHYQRITFPCYVQPKFDGVRCLAFKRNNEVVLMSRGKKEFKNLNHIRRKLKNLLTENQVFDGELYSDEINFQEIIRRVNKKNNPHPNEELVRLYIYDTFNTKHGDDFKDRLLQIPDGLCETVLCESEDDIFDMYKRYVNDGYEGIMVRNLLGEYKMNSRSYNLLKYKEFITEDFEIVDVKEANGADIGTGIFVLKNSAGVNFSSSSIGTRVVRREYFVNKANYIGKMLTVKFQEYTEMDVPRFPKVVAIRDYEESEVE